MGLHSIFRKKQPEATSVADALAGATVSSTPKIKKRKMDARGSDGQDEQLPEKKRARRRLIGAIAMVLAVVIGLPMVLDSEPKPSGKNIVIQIPSKDVPQVSSNSKPQVANDDSEPVDHPTESASAPQVADAAKIESKSESKPPAESVVKKESQAPVKETVAESKPVTPTAVPAIAQAKPSKPAKSAEPTESARATAILDGIDSIKNVEDKPDAKIASSATSPSKTSPKLAVQIGAFATQEKVNELRSKLSSAGIKSYTQKVATSSGDKIRVRVGPFSDKDSADKARAQIEKLGLNGTVMAM